MADAPPPEDLPGGAGGAGSTPPWEDEPAARPPVTAVRPNRPLLATRGRAPLLASSSAAQVRVIPREAQGAALPAPMQQMTPASPAEHPPAPVVPVRAEVVIAEAATAPVATTELTPDPLTDRWLLLLQPLLGRLTGFARELGWQAQCIGFDDAAQPWRLVLRVERESLRQGSHCDRLQAALAEQLGVPVRLDVEAGRTTDSAARRDVAERERAQAAAEAAIRTDPLVLELLQRFPGARLVPETIRPVSGAAGS